jgi:hypothetical protein
MAREPFLCRYVLFLKSTRHCEIQEVGMKLIVKLAAASCVALGLGIVSASADDCSGHNHDTGTALGAVGGAAIGGLASNSVTGAVVGGVAGGFAGNAIARSNDCDHHARVRHERDSYIGRDGRRHHYRHR